MQIFQFEQIRQIQTYVRISVKWEKTDGSKRGGTKNSNKCSVFPATYKLLHLHTNFILKHLNKTPSNPVKSSISLTLTPKIQISHPISSNLTKINTSTHLKPQSKTTIQTTFFLYKYKNPKKNPHFYRLPTFH